MSENRRDTGFVDRNGSPIREGDIICHYCHPKNPEYFTVGKVFWSEEEQRFMRTNNGQHKVVGLGNDCVYEVIGNAEDNPELITE